jgi:hypothetical protein
MFSCTFEGSNKVIAIPAWHAAYLARAMDRNTTDFAALRIASRMLV